MYILHQEHSDGSETQLNTSLNKNIVWLLLTAHLFARSSFKSLADSCPSGLSCSISVQSFARKLSVRAFDQHIETIEFDVQRPRVTRIFIDTILNAFNRVINENEFYD